MLALSRTPPPPPQKRVGRPSLELFALPLVTLLLLLIVTTNLSQVRGFLLSLHIILPNCLLLGVLFSQFLKQRGNGYREREREQTRLGKFFSSFFFFTKPIEELSSAKRRFLSSSRNQPVAKFILHFHINKNFILLLIVLLEEVLHQD